MSERPMTTKELLEAHEAMTRAWYDNWLKEQRRRMDEVFSRRAASKEKPE